MNIEDTRNSCVMYVENKRIIFQRVIFYIIVEHIFSIIWDVFAGVLNLYLGILTGWIFINSPLNRFKKEFITITINVVVPIIIFISMLTINFDNNILYPVIAAILVTILGIYIPKFLARGLHDEEATPAEICTATFPNALNYPFPVIFQFAPLGLGIASIFVALTTITRNTIGFLISGTSIDKDAMKTIMKFPPVWGIIIGLSTNLLFNDVGNSISNISFVEVFLQVGIFLTIMTVGFGITMPNLDYIKPIFRVSFTRFLVMGIVGLLILLIFNPPLFIAITLLVQLTAPPAVVNGIYAEELGLDTDLTSQLIVTLTFIALFFLPLQLLLIQFISG